MPLVEVTFADLYGLRLAYRDLGPRDAPAVFLVHGLGGSSAEWGPALELLARNLRVVAADLPGYGASDKERGDYSLGAFANAVRDLMDHLGVEAATLVGHSMGGGVAMMFAYQYPERVRELVLVSAGGLGPEVTPVLRSATLPGADLGLKLLASRPVAALLRRSTRAVQAVSPKRAITLEQVAHGLATFADPLARKAFRATARGIIDWQGQRVDARSRLPLTRGRPVLFIHGDPDPFIPLAHTLAAHESLGHSTLEVFPKAGHYPFLNDPERFASLVADHVLLR